MKPWPLVISALILLSACEPQQDTAAPVAAPVVEVIPDNTAIAEPVTPQAAIPVPEAEPQRLPVILDLSLDEQSLNDIREQSRTLTLPQHQPLPDMFQHKPKEPSRISVSGKLLMDEDESKELRESLQGAEISIKASID